MIYLRLSQAGERVNHKRVGRRAKRCVLYRRKKVPVADRLPLGWSQVANWVRSKNFVFDRTAQACVSKSLEVCDDVAHATVAILSELG